MLIGMFFLPFGFVISNGLGASYLFIRWIAWTYQQSFSYAGFQLVPLDEILSLSPYWVLRFLFVYWTMRFYQSKSTIKQSAIVGVISELPALVLSLPSLRYLGSPVEILYTMILPFPAFLMYGILIMILIPRAIPSKPW